MDDSFEEYTSSEEVKQSGKVCSWCGKPEPTSRWSGARFSYCSFRCLTAAEYRSSLLVAILMTPVFMAILLFPEAMYELFLVGITSSEPPGPIAVGGTVVIIIMISGSSIGSLYAAYVGWTVRRGSDTVFIGDMPDTQLYPKQGQYGDTGHRCDWCGNTRVSASWSGKRGEYCSLRCNAAGDHRRYILLFVLVFALTCTVGLMVVLMSAQIPWGFQIHPFIILLVVLLIGFNLMFAYPAYLGWSMNQAKRRDDPQRIRDGGPGEI